MSYNENMRKTGTERNKDYIRRKKLRGSGYKHIELWVLPETAKLMRWAIRDKVSVLKPRKDVVDNSNAIIEQLKEVEEL